MPEPPDHFARAQALDTTRSFIVEAPAGSGKTGLLIQRYLKLLAIVEHPAEVLAITFTRKATAEMQERVLLQLTSARDHLPAGSPFEVETRKIAQAVLARDVQLGWHLIDSPRTLRIRTIDSVAAEIARGLPILSGSGGGLAPTDDAAELHAQAAHRTLMQLGGADQQLSGALETLLLHRDGSFDNCKSLIANMLATRDQWGALVPLDPQHLKEDYLDETILPRLNRALDLAICRGLTRLTQLVPPAILARLCTLAAEMAHAEGYQGAPSPIELCRNRYESPAARAEDLTHWRALIHLLVKPSPPRDWRKSLNVNHIGFQILKNHKAELLQIIAEVSAVPNLVDELCAIESLPPALYPPEQWRVTKALFRVLARALVELQFVFADAATCDFAELGLLARAALSRDGALEDLRTTAGTTLQHLLVDEMQDTSTAQYELIQLLTQSWDGYGQTVFLVGDPKQSIYLFRQARVERFVQTLNDQRLAHIPLIALHLTANFRSQAQLVQSFNQDFAQIFTPPPQPTHTPGAPGLEPETWDGSTQNRQAPPPHPKPQPHQVPFRPAIAMRPPTTAAGRQWHAQSLSCLPTPAENTGLRIRSARDHAQVITEITTRWRQSPGSTSAVLVRTRSHLLDIVKSFKQAQIPYRAVEIEPLAERQEILDLLALTRALLHPADRTAWLALLRAPWCGLALADLHTLTGSDDPAHRRTNLLDLIAQRADLLSPDALTRLQPFWSVMTSALAQRSSLSLTTLVARTWEAFAAPHVLSPEARTNATRYFELLHNLQAAQPGPPDLATLERKLGKLYASPATHPGAVDLMTIHKSKGLEWDVVFVPALEKTSRPTTTQLLSWLELDPEPATRPGAPGHASETWDGPPPTSSPNPEPDRTIAPGILAPIQARGTGPSQLIAWMSSIEKSREAAERKRLFYVACTRAREELHLFASPSLNAKGELNPKPGSLLAAAWPAAEAHVQPPAEPVPAIVDTLAAGSLLHFRTHTRVLQDHRSEAELIVGGITPRQIERIPLHLLPTTSAHAVSQPTTNSPRPEGSYAARAFGNATHAFLDQLAQRLITETPQQLLAALPTWATRITAVLRASGLATTQRYAAALARALANTLADPEGLWLLSPHPRARTESSLTSINGTLRLDRTFLAGPTPGSTGSTHLWVVDYKTATHAQSGLTDFLTKEKAKYQPQLETYAQALTPQGLPIRLALYYPLLPALIWWPFTWPSNS